VDELHGTDKTYSQSIVSNYPFQLLIIFLCHLSVTGDDKNPVSLFFHILMKELIPVRGIFTEGDINTIPETLFLFFSSLLFD
jgi:hypothetical protein